MLHQSYLNSILQACQNVSCLVTQNYPSQPQKTLPCCNPESVIEIHGNLRQRSWCSSQAMGSNPSAIEIFHPVCRFVYFLDFIALNKINTCEKWLAYDPGSNKIKNFFAALIPFQISLIPWKIASQTCYINSYSFSRECICSTLRRFCFDLLNVKKHSCCLCQSLFHNIVTQSLLGQPWCSS